MDFGAVLYRLCDLAAVVDLAKALEERGFRIPWVLIDVANSRGGRE